MRGQSAGCAGIALAVSHRPRQMQLNPDPSGSSLPKSVWNAIQPARPYSGLDFPLEEKRISPISIVVIALSLSAGQAGSATGHHWPGQNFRKAYSACDLTPRIKHWEFLGILLHEGLQPLKFTLHSIQND